MVKRILIDGVHSEEVRVVVTNDSRLEEFDFETASRKQIKSNIYLGKITRVEPSLQAAFVEYGGNKQGFLPFSEMHFDYYQIPVADKEKLSAAMAEASKNDLSKEELQEQQDELPDDSLDTQDLEQLPEESEEDKSAATDSKEPEEIKSDEDTPEDSLDTPAASGEEDVAEVRRGRSVASRQYSHYKIQEVIKRNQIVLVQVIKEERGNKGASLTTYISLAGRYCVLMPNTERQGGVSRRINSVEDRRRLKDIVSSLEVEKGMSMIVRTAGLDHSKEEIQADYEYLHSIWNDIRKRTVNSEAPSLVFEDGNLIKRSLRDMYKDDIEEILVEGEDAYKSAREFMEAMAPNNVDKVQQYNEPASVFKKFGMDRQLDELYDSKSNLKSGGYVIITPTEALVSIDVNSGRATRGRSIEETAVRTNLEAAWEIARQLRLRDLAGLVVIDFIDMRELRNRRAVERALKDALKTDRAKIQTNRISIFGLLEMSRQRLRSSLHESSSITCPQCSGVGMVRSDESMAIMVLRAIESEAMRESRNDEIKLMAPSQTALYLLNNKRDEIISMEKAGGVEITIEQDFTMSGSDYYISRPRKRAWGNKPYRDNTSSNRYSDDKRNDSYDNGGDVKDKKPVRKRSYSKNDSSTDRASNRRSEKKDNDDSIGNSINNDPAKDTAILDDIKKPRGGARKKATRVSVSPRGSKGTTRRSYGGKPTANDDSRGPAPAARGRSKTASKPHKDDNNSSSSAGSSENKTEGSEENTSKIKGLWKKMTQ